MALVDNRNISAGLGKDRRMTESEWTQELIRHNQAVWGESDQRWRAAAEQQKDPTPTVSQAEPESPSGGLSAQAREEQKPPVSQAPDRGRTLRKRARRLTGRTRHDKNPR